ncbi:MAG: DUF5658 family protein [Euryarchaeota archaeon]|nr:DUF5658 family protein [Euryarchaeota archaeon]
MIPDFNTISQYPNKHINTQRIFFFLAFITFGIGDALTGALLMSTKGIHAESNNVFRYLYETHGPGGFITIKLTLTAVLLIAVFIIYRQSNGRSYWMTTGWLVALCMGGIMAITANLQAVMGLAHMGPTDIIVLYFILTILFIQAGDLIDRKKPIFLFNKLHSILPWNHCT